MSKYVIKDYVPDLPIDYAKEPYGTPYKGLWRQNVETEKGPRKIVTYIPQEYFPYQKFAMVFVPSGIDIEEFVNASKWVAFAEKNATALVFAAPEKKWGTPDKEADFVSKAFDQTFHTVGVISYDMKYAVGFGDGADFLANYLLDRGGMFSGIVLCGAKDVSKAAAKKAKENRKLPVWIINEKDEESPALFEHLFKLNNCLDEGLRNDWAKVYNESLNLFEEAHSTDAASRVWVSNVKNAAELYKNEAWVTRIYNDFLAKRYHHDHMFHRSQVKQNYTLEELGMKVYKKRMPHLAFDKPQERVWSVYTPTDYDPKKAYPMVVVIHGFQCTHDYMVKNTEFWRIAEQRKFIAVFTQGLPFDGTNYGLPCWRSGGLRMMPEEHIQSEIDYFRAVVEDVEKKYSIDKRRVYVTGHSNGGAMTYALSMRMGDVFTASAQVGAPVGQFKAVKDMPKDHYRMPAMNVECEFDRCHDPLDKDGPWYWETQWRKVENGVPLNKAPSVVDNGPNIVWTWTNKDGIPVVKDMMYKDSIHSYHADIAWYVWEFFCGFEKDEDGKRYYGGLEIK